MTAHQTRDAVAIAMRAYDHAIRLGHRHFGAEHFLLALAAADQPAGAVLRESVWSRRSPRPRAGASRDGVFLPHDAGGLQGIGNARREAESRHAPLIDVEDLALGFLAVTEGPLPTILSRLGVSAPTLLAVIRG
jgi:hypothetical protein